METVSFKLILSLPEMLKTFQGGVSRMVSALTKLPEPALALAGPGENVTFVDDGELAVGAGSSSPKSPSLPPAGVP